MQITVPTIATLTMTSANTEYVYNVPANVHYILFKLRDPGTNLFMSYAKGVVASQTNPYMTIPAGSSKEINSTNLPAGLPIYFATGSSSMTLEIETWQ
jgi:hypothetical protein